MKYVIAALEIDDYKMVSHIELRPEPDATWILLGGDNANGKTGVLEAIEALLKGADAVIEEPVRTGAARAEIRGTLQPDGDAPALTVRRRIELDGSTTLEVRDDLGKVRSPQALLDALLGRKFIDPIEFLRLKGPAQRAELLKIIDTDGELAKLDERRQRLYDRRTEVGRDVKRATGAVDSMPEIVPGEPISVTDLSDELQRIHGVMTAAQTANHRHADAERELKESANAVGVAELQLERAQRALELARNKRADAERVAAATRAALPHQGAHDDAGKRSAAIREQIARAGSHNEAIAAQRATQARRAHLVQERDKHQYEHDELERQIETIDAAKTARLLAAQLPIPDLGFTDVGVTYKGHPLSSASGAQRICVAIAMAAAASPKLRDVWIRDAAILDDNTMRTVAEFARAHGIRPWLERVGTRDEGVIEIRDGRRVEPAQKELFK